MRDTPPDHLTEHRESLWSNKNFLLLWCGQGAGALGPRVAAVALPLVALELLDAGTFEASLVTFLGWLPYLLFSLPAGLLADRWDQRRVMVFCDVARMVLMLSVPLVAAAGHLSLGYLYGVIGLSGTVTVLFTVAYRSQLPQLVRTTHLVDANGKLQMSDSAAEMAGPPVAGALVSLLDAAGSLAANALTYAISAVTLWLIRTPGAAPRRQTGAAGSIGTAVREGVAYVRGQRVLLALLLCTSTINFFVMANTSIQVVFLLRELHASPTAIGFVLSASAVGGLTAGVFARRLAARFGTARIIWLAMLVPGPLYLLMPLATPGWGIAWYAAGLAALAANSTTFNIAALSYRQSVCPPHLLNRVNSVYLWICYGVIPFGSLAGGALGTTLGLRATIWICALGMWSAALFVTFSPLRTMRDVPRTVSALADMNPA
ncbi:MFS transporter [Sphaerisporangium sp. B11E5]|uniref:MFS transporter n=1 Tax=Sphaerisporangium sp. B11E5 TaxID=3153563 RepID=UPI00325F2ECC